jgi:DNA (cytosine-5)-methyltransferase 1
MSLTIGSLFSGIGGLELGLERAGLGPVVWQVEREPYCRAVLAKHWPDAVRHDDVCTVGADTLAPVDVICGGFPCQDISDAGKKVGIGGERSGLWSEYARIVRELRPRYVVVENVAALLRRGIERVLGDLAESGYDAEWDCVPAAAVGAPHIRDRLFVVGYRPSATVAWTGGERWILADPPRDRRLRHEHDAHESAQREVEPLAARGGADVADSHGERELQPQGSEQDERGWSRDGLRPSRVVQDTDGRPVVARGEWRRTAQAGGAGWWATEPDVGRVAHGVPARLDRLAALGNAVVPEVAKVAGRLILTHDAATISPPTHA